MSPATSSSAVSSRKRRNGSPGGQVADSCQRGVTVIPSSSHNDVTVQNDGTIVVRVTAAPADGAANRAVLAALADALSLPKSRIEIVRGASARLKLVRFAMSGDDLDRRLQLVAESKGQY